MYPLQNLLRSALHLFYPHTCCGCGSDLLPAHQLLCGACIVQLPHTGFAAWPNNPIERLFIGRLALEAAASQLYFAKAAVAQQLVHQLKYKGHQEIGLYLGQRMGEALLQSGRFVGLDCLVPMPLHAAREKRRGYNQAEVLCRGMAQAMQVPVGNGWVVRVRHTATQTQQQRTDRWLNVDAGFAVADTALLAGKHILLVDDVVTTGATLDACGNAILQVPGTRLSIATLACAVK
jgi:ComF family protein